MTWQQDVFETGDGVLASMAGGSFRTSTRPTLNLPLLLRASVCAFTLQVSHARYRLECFL